LLYVLVKAALVCEIMKIFFFCLNVGFVMERY
jgi:hypothetical protein